MPLDLREVVRDTTRLIEELFLEKGISLRLQLPDVPVTVLGDADALGLLLRNLLDTTLKFTPHGEVRLELCQLGDTVYVQVEDSGPGMPPEALLHVFKRFYQADYAQRRSGSGLGLALAKSIADWHGGKLGAENTASGARFVLELPRYLS